MKRNKKLKKTFTKKLSKVNKKITVRRGVKGRWGVKGHLQNDSYLAMYVYAS